MNDELVKIKNNKNKSLLLVLTIVLGLGISFGLMYFMYQYRDSRENKLNTGLISVDFEEQSNRINMTNVLPQVDDVGLTNTPYQFSVTNTSNVPIKAIITLDVDSNTTMKIGAIRYALYIDDVLVKKDNLNSDLSLYEIDNLAIGDTINCKLVFWVDYYYKQETTDETFIAKVKVDGQSIDTIYVSNS